MIASIDKQLQEVPPPSNDLNQERVKKEDEKTQVLSDYRKLTRQSEHFLTDIMSDANGVSFHRFQMAVWTIVLGIIFPPHVTSTPRLRPTLSLSVVIWQSRSF